ncbi:MAG: hypothetical protein ACTSR8_00335 [Promethearchaeota archaeon]
MIVNDYNNRVSSGGFSKIITIEDNGEDTVYVFPKTTEFITEIQKKQNAEKLHHILKRSIKV